MLTSQPAPPRGTNEQRHDPSHMSWGNTGSPLQGIHVIIHKKDMDNLRMITNMSGT